MRKRLASLLVEDRPDSASLMAELRAIREETGADSCSLAVYLLAHVQLPEMQAERLLEDLLRHRREVTRALGRDPGLRVAAIDYLSNFRNLLANPTIVESAQLERTERSAITDPLTRLYNRRYFGQVLGREVRRSHRYGLRLALLMLDIDGFKQLNDNHGHLFGDVVLRRVSGVIRHAVREADVPCRYGGEEFAVILPETDRLGGYAVGQRIRQHLKLDLRARPVGGRHVTVSLSGGVASYPVDGSDPTTLIARADEALYLSKNQGKDRVSLYYAERRSAIRYPAKSTSRVDLRQPRGGGTVRVRPLDLSRDGALLDLGHELDRETAVELIFGGRDAVGRPRTWVVTGRVVRVEPRGPAGRGCRAAVRFDRPLVEECLFQQVQRTRSLRAALGGRA